MKNGISELLKKDKRVAEIELNDGTLREDVMGLLGLNDGYVVDEYSHCVGFGSRKELRHILKYEIELEK